MKPARFEVLFPWFLGVLAGLWLAVLANAACTPKQGAAIEFAAPLVEKATCVILESLEPRAAPFCATADDLAPYVDDLVKQLEVSRRGTTPALPDPAASTSTPFVAMSLAPPKRARHPARRHCAQWIADAGESAGDGGR